VTCLSTGKNTPGIGLPLKTWWSNGWYKDFVLLWNQNAHHNFTLASLRSEFNPIQLLLTIQSFVGTSCLPMLDTYLCHHLYSNLTIIVDKYKLWSSQQRNVVDSTVTFCFLSLCTIQVMVHFFTVILEFSIYLTAKNECLKNFYKDYIQVYYITWFTSRVFNIINAYHFLINIKTLFSYAPLK
jgi:hypothetical protein